MRPFRRPTDGDLTVAMAIFLLILGWVTLVAYLHPGACPGRSEAVWTNQGWLCAVEVD